MCAYVCMWACECMYVTLCVGVHCMNSNNMCQRLMATAINVSSGVEHYSVPDDDLHG